MRLVYVLIIKKGKREIKATNTQCFIQLSYKLYLCELEESGLTHV